MQEGLGEPCFLIKQWDISHQASGRAPKYIDSAQRPRKLMLLLPVGILELLFKCLFSSLLSSLGIFST